MERQDTLSERISRGKALTETEQAELLVIVGKGCQDRTKSMLKAKISCIPDVENFGIYGRVHLDEAKVSYCAGQSYPDEIRTLRKCLLGR